MGVILELKHGGVSGALFGKPCPGSMARSGGQPRSRVRTPVQIHGQHA
jgi:hypothetical protein